MSSNPTRSHIGVPAPMENYIFRTRDNTPWEVSQDQFRLKSGRILCPLLSNFFWLFLATAYMTPAKNPTPIAETDPIVIASPKNNIPDAATGSLFSAPTMLNSSISRQVHSRIQARTCMSCCSSFGHTKQWCTIYQLLLRQRRR